MWFISEKYTLENSFTQTSIPTHSHYRLKQGSKWIYIFDWSFARVKHEPSYINRYVHNDISSVAITITTYSSTTYSIRFGSGLVICIANHQKGNNDHGPYLNRGHHKRAFIMYPVSYLCGHCGLLTSYVVANLYIIDSWCLLFFI